MAEESTSQELAQTEQPKEDSQIGTLVKYVPDTVENKEGYIKLINDQILGRDKKGQPRPMLDLVYFLQVCQSSGLNPVKREIYGIYYWNSMLGKDELTIMTGIDGFRIAAERSGLYAGSDEPKFDYDEQTKKLERATVTVYKLNKITGERMPTTATARMSEFYPKNPKKAGMWNNMPEIMLSKCAEAQALRKAFPNTGQIYVPEEFDQHEVYVNKKSTKNERLAAIEAEKIAAQVKEEAHADENND